MSPLPFARFREDPKFDVAKLPRRNRERHSREHSERRAKVRPAPVESANQRGSGKPGNPDRSRGAVLR